MMLKQASSSDTLYRVFGSPDWGNREVLSDEILKDLIEGLDKGVHLKPALLEADDFTEFISDRAKKLLDLIQAAVGKSVTGRDSQEVVQEFGGPLF